MDIEKDSLKHGEYKVKITQLEGTNIISTETVVKPLLQEELADGWLQIQPKRKDNIHHFSIYLSQLPMNLWSKVKKTYTIDKEKDYYRKIKNGNYHYTIKYSTNDDNIFELYRNITCKTPDLDKIRTLYKELESNRVRGWIMIRALSMIK
jgi:hypothetical protein